MNKQSVMRYVVAIATSITLSSQSAELCANESDIVTIDLTPGAHTAATTERIRYSTSWGSSAGAGASAIVMVGDDVLNSAAGSGFVDWTPMSNGTYTLTHKVMSGSAQIGELLTATFLVEGLAPVYTSTQTTEVPVPYAWLVQYWPTTADEYEAYEAAAKVTAANGRPAWECYVAGLDPTNAASAFTADISFANGTPYITWSPNLNTNGIERIYTVLGKTNLIDTVEWAPTNSAHRFFKVKIEMP